MRPHMTERNAIFVTVDKVTGDFVATDSTGKIVLRTQSRKEMNEFTVANRYIPKMDSVAEYEFLIRRN